MSTPFSAEVDLAICDQEPIHTPNAIQPHGALLLLGAGNGQVTLVSANTDAILGQAPKALLGLPLSQLFGEAASQIMAEDGGTEFPNLFEPVMIPVQDGDGSCRPLLCLSHRCRDGLVLEVEPLRQSDPVPPDSLRLRLRAIARMSQAVSLTELSRLAADEVRRVTGYDRVMIYRFHEDWHGEVVAETPSGLPVSYLGLHFPASDIPVQARRLYLENRLRAIVDIDAVPVPLIPAENPVTGQPLDLTHTFLRAVSPTHVEYLRNMEVRASLSISLLVYGRLWGLVVCHHHQPRHPSPRMRVACQEIGEIVSANVIRLIEDERARRSLEARQACAAFDTLVAAGTSIGSAASSFFSLIGAHAVIGRLAGRTVTGGPAPRDGRSLAALHRHAQDGLYLTDHLAQHNEIRAEVCAAFAGGAYMALSPDGRDFLFFGRAEVVRELDWGGNPSKPWLTEDGSPRLHPRQSFAAWRETVRGRSRPFSELDRSIARTIRQVILNQIALASRRQFEAAVHERDARVRHLLTASPAVVFSCEPGPNPAISYISENVQKQIGYSPLDFLGQAGFRLNAIHPDDRSRVLAGFQEVLSRGQHSHEYRFRHKDGHFIWLHEELSLFRDGETAQIIGVQTDITARKEAEQALSRKTEELERSNRELEQFAYVASHDLQEPLRKIQAFGELLAAEYGSSLGEEGQQYIRHMTDATIRLQRLIEDLLRLARVQTRAQPFAAVDLAEVLGEVLIDLSEQLRETGGEVAVGAMPVVEADRLQMRQLFQNLIGNALKFHHPGTPPQIRVTAVGAGDEVRIEIADNGIGFDMKYAAQIFEPFKRLHGRGKYAGTGIGLALCDKIVARHRGAITAQGQPGQGAVFTVTLPARQRGR